MWSTLHERDLILSFPRDLLFFVHVSTIRRNNTVQAERDFNRHDGFFGGSQNQLQKLLDLMQN